uniref:Orf1rev n=1 Tax=Pediococcus pentosaceus TaxID=1255 RepID=Q9X3B2_PEDPE|nr:Orf1rev [Pediococcus pentosaceus]
MRHLIFACYFIFIYTVHSKYASLRVFTDSMKKFRPKSLSSCFYYIKTWLLVNTKSSYQHLFS